MSDIIKTDSPLSESGRSALKALAGAIIPASAEHQAPGADDAVIFEDLLLSAGPALAVLNEGMQILNASAGPEGFASADPETQLSLAEQFRASHGEVTALLISLISQTYYRDPRVLESLNLAPRAPFPEGFELKEGDWSLLDPVRARGQVYRCVN